MFKGALKRFSSLFLSVIMIMSVFVTGTASAIDLKPDKPQAVTDIATFDVNGTIYNSLTDAISAATSNNVAKITLASSGYVPAGIYTIPSGKTLLIPFDSSYTIVTNSNISNTNMYTTETSPTEFRRLTLLNGAEIIVNGSVSVASKVNRDSKGQAGPCGKIELNEGSKIVLNNGSNLYAFGYIIGSGVVEAKSGSRVYENLFIADYPGSATNTSTLANSEKVFPFSKFTIRNIEAKLEIYNGAVEQVFANLYGTWVGYNNLWINLIGTSSSYFFQTADHITKSYVNGRQKIEINGTSQVNSISIKLYVTMSTSTMAGVPIPYNFDIVVNEGNFTLGDNVILSKGSTTTINKNGTVSIPSGKKLYVLDGADDKQPVGTQPDAKVDVNGIINVSGALYTSESGADIISSEGTGVINFNSAAAGNTTVKVKSGNTTAATINVTSAQLHNGDNSYTATAGSTANTTFSYCAGHDKWEKNSVTHVKVEFETNGGSSVETQIIDKGSVPTSPADPERSGYVFDGWFSDEALTTEFTFDSAVNENIKLYAKWTQNITTYTIIWINTDGSELYREEGVPAGSIPHYNGPNPPVHPSENDYTNKHFVFVGWKHTTNNSLTVNDPIYADTTFQAVFKTYTIKYQWSSDYSTCTATATNDYDDDDVITETVNTLLTITTQPACTTNGKGTYTAEFTNTEFFSTQTKNNVSIPKLGHDFGEWTQTTAPTCTEAGEETRYCSRCDATETREVEATGHTAVVDEAVAPTCTETGLTEGSHCSVCNAVLVAQETVAALGHDFGEWTQTTAPTCTEAGEETRYCSRCDATETREVEATGHTAVVDEAVAPTCTETGLTEGSHCSVCGAVIVAQEVVSALGHDWGEWTVTTAPTCTEAGVETRTCSRCDAVETRPVEALGHDLIHHDAKEPTCTEVGWNAYDTCSRCDYTTYEEIPALGHDYKLTGWSWVDDLSSATATFTCDNDTSHVETVEATVVAGEEQFVSGTTYKTVYTATAVFNEKEYKDTAEKTYQANTVVGTSLVLDGILGINVYVKTVPEAKAAVLTFSYTDEGQRSVTYDLSELTETGSGYRLEFVDIQSGVMDYDLILTILDENGDKMTIKNIRRGFTGEEYSYCMADWAQSIVDQTVEELTAKYDTAPEKAGYGAALRELALAILNYGEKAANYFGKTFHSEDYSFDRYEMSAADLAEATKDGWMARVSATEGYEKSYLGGTVVLEGAMSLRIYFSKSVTVTDENGNKLTLSRNENGYFVEKVNIASGDMHRFYKFNVTEKDGTSYTVEYSIMTWIRWSILNGSDTKLKDLSKAMFYYWKTAHSFFYTYYWTEDDNGN